MGCALRLLDPVKSAEAAAKLRGHSVPVDQIQAFDPTEFAGVVGDQRRAVSKPGTGNQCIKRIHYIRYRGTSSA